MAASRPSASAKRGSSSNAWLKKVIASASPTLARVSTPTLYAFNASREPVVASSLLVELGYVDRKELHAAADMVRFGTSKRFVNFLTCLAFEVWLRTVTGEGQAVAAGRSVSARP